MKYTEYEIKTLEKALAVMQQRYEDLQPEYEKKEMNGDYEEFIGVVTIAVYQRQVITGLALEIKRIQREIENTSNVRTIHPI